MEQGAFITLTSGMGILASVSLGGQFLPVGHPAENTTTYTIPLEFPVGLALLQHNYANGVTISEMVNVVAPPGPDEEDLPFEG
ncbi:MAG: hypothetical protein P4L36_13485 [Holophaga sp.]|nr:hypothetical protein [Holophaga sp.]